MFVTQEEFDVLCQKVAQNQDIFRTIIYSSDQRLYQGLRKIGGYSKKWTLKIVRQAKRPFNKYVQPLPHPHNSAISRGFQSGLFDAWAYSDWVDALLKMDAQSIHTTVTKLFDQKGC